MDKLQLPEGVEFTYTDKAAHVTTNDALMQYLRQKGNGSMPLTRMILTEYQIECGAPLGITERSMATELLIHAYLDGALRREASAGEQPVLQNGAAAQKRDRRHRHG